MRTRKSSKYTPTLFSPAFLTTRDSKTCFLRVDAEISDRKSDDFVGALIGKLIQDHVAPSEFVFLTCIECTVFTFVLNFVLFL